MKKSEPKDLMKCLHNYGNYYLYDQGGKPVVIKRWISEARTLYKGSPTLFTPTMNEESGDLDGKHITPGARAALIKAWNEHLSWCAVMRMQPGSLP